MNKTQINNIWNMVESTEEVSLDIDHIDNIKKIEVFFPSWVGSPKEKKHVEINIFEFIGDMNDTYAFNTMQDNAIPGSVGYVLFILTDGQKIPGKIKY
jgi:hypothetical protein